MIVFKQIRPESNYSELTQFSQYLGWRVTRKPLYCVGN